MMDIKAKIRDVAPRRAFYAPSGAARCDATIHLRDGSSARCMRRARADQRCWQHPPGFRVLPHGGGTPARERQGSPARKGHSRAGDNGGHP